LQVLLHLLKSDKEIIKEEELQNLFTVPQSEWQNFADQHKGMIVAKFGSKPSALRVDQIDRDVTGHEGGKIDALAVMG
jgi:ribonuclease-3